MVRQYGLFISVMYGAMFIADIHRFAKLNILNELTKKKDHYVIYYQNFVQQF